MRRIVSPAIWAGVAFWLWAAPTAAQFEAPRAGQSYRVHADSLEYERARRLYVARGNARVRQGDRELRADWMAFSSETGRGVASGNVVYTDGDDTLEAAFIEFDVESLEGVIFDGSFVPDSGAMRLEGAEIQKTGDQTYRFERGRFTTCDCPDAEGRDPWQIRAREADLEVGGYGVARNTTFEILEVPVVWLPWMIYPLKTERQTGFLFPELAFGSRNGFEIGVPFFWAARHNVNVTATPIYASKRGPKGEVDVEFLMGERSGGRLFGAYAYDTEIDPHTPATPFGRHRWSVFGNQFFSLPGEVGLRTDLNFISDNQYVLDFREARAHRTDRFLEANAFAGRSFGPQGPIGVVGSALWANDLQSPNDQDRDKYLLQRLPAVDVDLVPLRPPLLPQLVPAVGVHYTRFAPREQAVDVFPLGGPFGANVVGPSLFLDTGVDAEPDVLEPGFNPPGFTDPHRDNAATVPGGTERNGFFDEGEPLADDGHRVLLTPRLGVPLRLFDALELYPEVGWRQSLYDTDFQGFAQRGLVIGRVDLRTRLRRSFPGGISHVLEPRVGWAFASRPSRPDQPLFVPQTAVPQQRLRELELDNITLDPADRFAEFNGVTWALANRVFRDSGAEEASELLADFVLSAGYDFDRGRFAGIYLDGSAHPTSRSSLRVSVGFDPEKARLDETLAEGRISFAGGHYFSLGYRFLRNIPNFFESFSANQRFKKFEPFERVNQLTLGIGISFLERWRLTYNFGYSFERGLLLVSRGGIEYTSRCQCWAVRLEAYSDRVGGLQVSLLYRIMGLGWDSGWKGGGTGAL